MNEIINNNLIAQNDQWFTNKIADTTAKRTGTASVKYLVLHRYYG